MKLIFEKGAPGQHLSLMPPCDVPEVTLSRPRTEPLDLPHVSETELTRHYTALAKRVHGVNDGFYPLGSCTMKYNPKINEDMAALPGFSQIHPLQPEETVQGCLEVLHESEKLLGEITGMDAMTFQPAAGAHGEFTGLLLIKAYHARRNDAARTKIIVPDSAHGTNPASAVMAGFTVVNIPSGEDGCVDVEALRGAVGPDTAGLMLTNPNTVGIFDRNILEITRIVHDAGGLCYYDGANLNAVMGVVRPGDMGFDVIHLNLHKTFSTPHGGGGPGSGPVGVRKGLEQFLPNPRVVRKPDGSFDLEYSPDALGSVSATLGNFAVQLKALSYILSLGREGLAEVGPMATLAANYVKESLRDKYLLGVDRVCKHEFVFDGLIDKSTGVTTLNVAKRLLDHGFHAPTIYFPLLFHESLMIEPTETESIETLDSFIAAMREIAREAAEEPQKVLDAPLDTPVRKPDDTAAALNPVVTYMDLQANGTAV